MSIKLFKSTEHYYPGRWWETMDEDRVRCLLCPRDCKLRDGQRGFCFVRQNIGGTMVLTSYGRSSGFCADPIEKKPLNHFYPGTSVLSFGTAGCNLGCRFCQNWDISKSREIDRLAEAAGPEKIAEAAVKMGCKSVAFTYNDPVIFAEYAIDIADACRAKGIKSVAVTAGYITDEARADFFSHMDATNVDLKGFTEDFYKKLCFSEMKPVLDTLEYLKNETNVWFEITTLLIPGFNDSDQEIHAECEWIMEKLGPDVPLHFTAFHPDFKMMDTPPTPASSLKRARKIAVSKGLRYVFTGNIHDTEGGITYCPGCGEIAIERDWYEIGLYNMEGNKCKSCGSEIPGHFDVKPGSWGRQRVPVRLSGL